MSLPSQAESGCFYKSSDILSSLLDTDVKVETRVKMF